MEFKALINSMLSPIVPKYFLFPQQLDQKKLSLSLNKVIKIVLSVIHFLYDQIKACFTDDPLPSEVYSFSLSTPL